MAAINDEGSIIARQANFLCGSIWIMHINEILNTFWLYWLVKIESCILVV